MMMYALLGAVVLVGLAAFAPGVLVLAARFLTGAPMNGVPRTDSSLLHPGTRSLTPGITRYSRWSARRGIERASIRISCTITLATLGYGYLTHPTLTIVAAGLGAWAAGTWQAWRLWQAWRIHQHTRLYVRPLHVTMSHVLGLDPHLPAEQYLKVPVDYQTNEQAESRIILPATFEPSEQAKKQVLDLALAKLALTKNTADHTWTMTGTPYLTIRLAPQPPSVVPWADWITFMDGLPAGELFLGLDKTKTPYTGSFNIEDPHWGFSVGSRRGKSTQAMSIVAQILHQDPRSRCYGIDPKMTSFDPIIGVPRFTVANDPRNVEGMWALILQVEAELNARMDAESKDATLKGSWPCLALVLDEVNQFAAMSAAHWKKIKEPKDPATAPIWMNLAAILWMGAQFNCHVIMYGQRLDEKATGGVGLRDSLGFRGLAGFRPQQWMMLVGTAPIPRSQKPRGRFIYSDGQEDTWVQNVLPTDQQLRDYASTCREPLPVLPELAVPPAEAAALIDLQMSSVLSGTGSLPALTPGPRTALTQDTIPDPGEAWIVGVAAGAAYLGLKEGTFAKRRTRSETGIPGETRQGNQPAWLPRDLDAWAATTTKEVAA